MGRKAMLRLDFLQQNKKKAKAEGKRCLAKTMKSKKKPIEPLHKEPLMCRLGMCHQSLGLFTAE